MAVTRVFVLSARFQALIKNAPGEPSFRVFKLSVHVSDFISFATKTLKEMSFF